MDLLRAISGFKLKTRKWSVLVTNRTPAIVRKNLCCKSSVTNCRNHMLKRHHNPCTSQWPQQVGLLHYGVVRIKREASTEMLMLLKSRDVWTRISDNQRQSSIVHGVWMMSRNCVKAKLKSMSVEPRTHEGLTSHLPSLTLAVADWTVCEVELGFGCWAG